MEEKNKPREPVTLHSRNVKNEYYHRVIVALISIYSRGGFVEFLKFAQSSSRVLVLVDSLGECHPTQISEFLGMSRPNVALTLKEMERKGLIKRKVDEHNRRQLFISLTPRGRSEAAKAMEPLVENIDEWFNTLSDGGESVAKLLEGTAKFMVDASFEDKPSKCKGNSK